MPSNKNEDGVPNGIINFQQTYGKYNADFINDTSKKVIYLTMDEGFSNEQTADVLDILREKDVRVTFFCTMDFIEKRPDYIRRMLDEGHKIGDHSITHQSMPSLSRDEQQSEIMTVVDYMKENYDYDVMLFRFPYGHFSDECLALVNNLGLKSVFWSFAYDDYSSEQPDPDESLEWMMQCLHPGAIYLLHADSATNLALLPGLIDRVRAEGYEFGGVYPY